MNQGKDDEVRGWEWEGREKGKHFQLFNLYLPMVRSILNVKSWTCSTRFVWIYLFSPKMSRNELSTVSSAKSTMGLIWVREPWESWISIWKLQLNLHYTLACAYSCVASWKELWTWQETFQTSFRRTSIYARADFTWRFFPGRGLVFQYLHFGLGIASCEDMVSQIIKKTVTGLLVIAFCLAGIAKITDKLSPKVHHQMVSRLDP